MHGVHTMLTFDIASLESRNECIVSHRSRDYASVFLTLALAAVSITASKTQELLGV
jgi:hypothetical protein